MLARALVGAAIVWPLVAGAAVWQRTSLSAEPSGLGGAGVPAVATVVYTAASRICHQRPERSFHTKGVSWPVCARCTGLYLAAPFAAVFAFRRRVGVALPFDPLQLVALAAVPTALTLAWEWGGLGTPANVWRFGTALPLGAAVAFVLVSVASQRQPPKLIG